MVKRICPTCNGRGWVMKPRQRRDRDGKVRTEQSKEACPTCNWSGWVDR